MDRTPLDSRLARAQSTALIVGVIAAILCGLGFMLNQAQFFRSYLMGYLYWLGMGLGCMALLMVQHLSGGRWGQVMRRFLEASAATMPLLTVLFLPIALKPGQLYKWVGESQHGATAAPHASQSVDQPLAANVSPDTAPEHGSDASHAAAEHGPDPILAKKAAYLNLDKPYGFYGRAIFYFVVWNLFALILNKWSMDRDRDGKNVASRRLQGISGIGLVLYALTMTFASFDWAMSLEPHWFSTIYGVLFLIGQGAGAMAFVTGLLVVLRDKPPLDQTVSIDRLQDLGNLMMAFVMLWAYMGFSQYLIIWSGNLPEETPWYVNRTLTSWRVVALALVAFHFTVPFLLLVSRANKRNPAMLGYIAAGLVLVRLLDLFWLIMPAFYRDGIHVHWLDLAVPVAIGGFWLALFFWRLRARIFVPVFVDPH